MKLLEEIKERSPLLYSDFVKWVYTNDQLTVIELKKRSSHFICGLSLAFLMDIHKLNISGLNVPAYATIRIRSLSPTPEEIMESVIDTFSFIENKISDKLEPHKYTTATNINELEGVLISLITQASLNTEEIDIELVKQTFNSIMQDIEKEVGIDYIQKFVSDYFNISQDLLKAKTRKREIVVARQVAMYLAKEYTNRSLKSIGYHFGNRDHSTVIHAISTINDMMDIDQRFLSSMEDIQTKFKMKVNLDANSIHSIINKMKNR